MGSRKHRGMGFWGSRANHGHHACGTSGNRAFDEYREETLRRLEDEQSEFREFMDRLRHARDKAEFDQFMADRGRRPPRAPEPEGHGAPNPMG